MKGMGGGERVRIWVGILKKSNKLKKKYRIKRQLLISDILH